MTQREARAYALHLRRVERSLHLIKVLQALGVSASVAHRANSYMYQRESNVFASIDATPDSSWDCNR